MYSSVLCYFSCGQDRAWNVNIITVKSISTCITFLLTKRNQCLCNSFPFLVQLCTLAFHQHKQHENTYLLVPMVRLVSTGMNLIFTLHLESLLKLQEKSYFYIIRLAVLIENAVKGIIILLQKVFWNCNLFFSQT